jgi:hypothetical protein
MSIALYLDENMPRAIAIGLRLRGVDVLTAQEDNRRKTDDSILLDRAGALGRVMVSFDAICWQSALTDSEKVYHLSALSMLIRRASRLAIFCGN